eukprot:6998891-Prymnesium_polylepis.1
MSSGGRSAASGSGCGRSECKQSGAANRMADGTGGGAARRWPMRHRRGQAAAARRARSPLCDEA